MEVVLSLNGKGEYEIETGISFFDYRLSHLALHGLFDLTVHAQGDLEVDEHHTVDELTRRFKRG